VLFVFSRAKFEDLINETNIFNLVAEREKINTGLEPGWKVPVESVF